VCVHKESGKRGWEKEEKVKNSIEQEFDRCRTLDIQKYDNS